jgi:sugar/nucleoside kinase (ribokinase family)
VTPSGSAGQVRIVSVGDLMVDVLATLPGPLAVGSDTPAAISYVGGGAAANLAAWAVVTGARATFVGRVGADALGRQAVTDLAAAGVDVRVATDSALPTGTCIVLVDPAGQRTMVPAAGANASGVEPPALPATADWLCMSGYALLRPATRSWAVAMLAAARERGWSIAVDAASAAPLAEYGAAAFLDLIGTSGVLLANEDEALVLAGNDDPSVAVTALASQVGAAVVKRGAAGVVWSAGGEPVAVPAVPADVVDTTGAGDAFAAGFLAAGGSGPDALRAGVALAARAVGQVGARPHVV